MSWHLSLYLWRRKAVAWCLRRLGLYVCIYCYVVTPYVGNNDEEGNIWCERCANAGLALSDLKRAREVEQWHVKYTAIDDDAAAILKAHLQ